VNVNHHVSALLKPCFRRWQVSSVPSCPVNSLGNGIFRPNKWQVSLFGMAVACSLVISLHPVRPILSLLWNCSQMLLSIFQVSIESQSLGLEQEDHLLPSGYLRPKKEIISASLSTYMKPQTTLEAVWTLLHYDSKLNPRVFLQGARLYIHMNPRTTLQWNSGHRSSSKPTRI
jgi:hypothetical protein